MITMNQPPLTQHISVPKDMGGLSCEAFTAGIVEGVLDGLDVVSDSCGRSKAAILLASVQADSSPLESRRTLCPPISSLNGR